MTAGEIIKKHNIHKTVLREELLSILVRDRRSFSLSELTGLLTRTKSKASILRTLKFYKEQGLVHTSMAADSRLKYFYTEEEHHYNTYFTCTNCGKSFVFDLPIPNLPGLKNLEIIKIEWVISGTCDNCNEFSPQVLKDKRTRITF